MAGAAAGHFWKIMPAKVFCLTFFIVSENSVQASRARQPVAFL